MSNTRNTGGRFSSSVQIWAGGLFPTAVSNQSRRDALRGRSTQHRSPRCHDATLRFRFFLACIAILAALGMPAFAIAQTSTNAVLAPGDLQRLFPATVYYSGQTAPTQLRNSGGVKFEDGHYVLASLVDTSGYSSDLAAKYQGYLITEVALQIAGKQLAPGAYGIGFVAGDQFLVTDVGGNEVLTALSVTDTAMTRPRPLQITTDPAGGFRLYAGRRYVRFSR